MIKYYYKSVYYKDNDIVDDQLFMNTKYWFRNGLPHCDNGPAAISKNGDEFWYDNGKLHREDGPAIIRAHGAQYYFRYGHCYGKIEYKVVSFIIKNINLLNLWIKKFLL